MADKEKSFFDRLKFWEDDEEEKKDDSLKARVATPPPLDVTTTVSTTKSTKEETPAGSKLENLGISAMAKANKLLDEANTLPAHSRDDFKKRVKDAQDAYEMAESKVEKRELAEKLAHAVTQLGAGLHGMKTGTDMSGLKFEKSDWEKKMDRNLAKFRDNLETARDEDRYSMAESQNRRSNLVSQASAASGIGSTYLSAAARDKDAAATSEKTTIKTENDGLKARMQAKKSWDKFIDDLQNNKKLEDPELVRRQLAARAKAIGVPPDEVDSIIKSEGTGWLSARDVRQIAAKLVTAAADIPEGGVPAAEQPAATAETPPPAAKKKIRWKTGKTAGQVYEVDDNQLKQFNQADYELI